MIRYSSYRTIIIGAGPAGASAAIYLARNLHPVVLLDAPKAIHGRTRMATSLDNFLGHDQSVSGPRFLEQINAQLGRYPQIKRYEEKVVMASKQGDEFVVETESGPTHRAEFLIVAVGLKDPMPKIAGLDPYYDTAIFHCLTCDWYQNRDKQTLIVSNDNQGLQTALAIILRHRPPLISVVPSEPDPRYSKPWLARARAEKIKVYREPLQHLEGNNGNLQAVVLTDGRRVAGEVMFTLLGHRSLDTFLDQETIPVKRDGRGFIKINWRTFESSVTGLYAVGPCNDGPDQAIIAGGQGALAALAIHQQILEKFDL